MGGRQKPVVDGQQHQDRDFACELRLAVRGKFERNQILPRHRQAVARIHYLNRKRQKTKGALRHALQEEQRRVLRRFDGNEALFVYKRRETGWKFEDRVLAIRYVSEVFRLKLGLSS